MQTICVAAPDRSVQRMGTARGRTLPLAVASRRWPVIHWFSWCASSVAQSRAIGVPGLASPARGQSYSAQSAMQIASRGLTVPMGTAGYG